MATSSSRQIQLLLAEGYHHYRESQFEKAKEVYDLTLDKLEASGEGELRMYFSSLVFLKGLALLGLEEYVEALESFDTVIEKEPLNVSAIIRRGVAHMRMEQYQKCWGDFKRALLLEPDNTQISDYVEELNAKLASLGEAEKMKYQLKQQISEMITFPQVEEDMLLNFSQLKLIDKQSVHSSKSVSIVKQPTATIEIETGEISMNVLIDKLVRGVIFSPEEIKEIERLTEVELEPKRLEEQLNLERRQFSPVKVFYDKGESPEKTESILRCSRNQAILHPSNRPTSSFSESALKYRRVSALQVKNIDGKVISNQESQKGEKGSDQEESSPDIEFVGIQNIQSLGRKEIPVYKTQNIKRKSSLKKGKSITTRPNEVTRFTRQGHIDLFTVNIDKPFSHHQSISKEQQRMHHKHSQSSEGSRVVINDEPEDIERASESRKSNMSREDEVQSPYLGLGATGLRRKESILKSKRKFEARREDVENVRLDN